MPDYFLDSSALAEHYRDEVGSRWVSQLITAALTALEGDVAAALEVIEINSHVMRRAMDIARIHGLRGADAIQLACTLLWRTPATGDLHFVSADAELNAAAVAEGLEVENPNLNP